MFVSMASAQSVQPEKPLNTFDLGETVVTATKTSTAIQNAPATINVITAKYIADHNITSVQEALQYLPGVYIDKAAQSESAVNMRGMDTKNILVLLDGIQMNDTYTGKVDFNQIPISNIQKIEVLQGGASTLYGGHAIAGVISITTKGAPPEIGTDINADLSYGSHNTWKKAVVVNSRINNKLAVGVNIEQRSSGGYPGYFITDAPHKLDQPPADAITTSLPQLPDGAYVLGSRGEKVWKRTNIGVNTEYFFDQTKSLKYSYKHYANYYRYQHPFSYVRDPKTGKMLFEGVLKFGNEYIEFDPSSFLGYNNESQSDSHQLIYRDTANNLTARAQYSKDKLFGFSSPNNPTSVDYTGPGDYSNHPGSIKDFSIDKTWKDVHGHKITAGIDHKIEKMTQKRANLAHWKDLDSITGYYEITQGTTKTTGIYAQDEYKLSDKLTGYLGARYDHYLKGQGHFARLQKDGTWKDSSSNSKSYNHVSPRLSLDYKADKNTNYYLSYGESFNPPQLYQMYRYGGGGMGKVIPNPNLNPEISKSWELGMKKIFDDNNKLNIALYHIRTSDSIAYTYFYNDKKKVQYKQYINYSQEKRRGVELSYEHKFDQATKAYFNYTWQLGTSSGPKLPNTNKQGYSHKIMYEIPKHLVHAGLSYEKGALTSVLDAEYVSSRNKPGSYNGFYGSNDAYFLMNTAFTYKLNDQVKLQFAIDNLFDRHYYDSNATSGRTFTLGLQYKY